MANIGNSCFLFYDLNKSPAKRQCREFLDDRRRFKLGMKSHGKPYSQLEPTPIIQKLAALSFGWGLKQEEKYVVPVTRIDLPR